MLCPYSKEETKKMDQRSSPSGYYGDGHYRIHVKESLKVILSRDVTFQEKSGDFWDEGKLPLPKGKKAIPFKWIYRAKTNPNKGIKQDWLLSNSVNVEELISVRHSAQLQEWQLFTQF